MNAASASERTGLSENYVGVLVHRGILESYDEPEIALLRRAVALRDRHDLPLKLGMALLRCVADDGQCPTCGAKPKEKP